MESLAGGLVVGAVRSTAINQTVEAFSWLSEPNSQRGLDCLHVALQDLPYRSLGEWDREWRFDRRGVTETALLGVPSVGPGGQLRTTLTPSVYRLTASTRVIDDVLASSWAGTAALDASLVPVSNLLDEGHVEARATFGYHELSLHATQPLIEAAAVIVVTHLGRPAWRTVFVLPVTDHRDGRPFDGLGWSSGTQPPRFDSCQ